MIHELSSHQRLFVKQVFELVEVFGWETRNKYRVCDERGVDIAYAAEQQKGLLGFIFRQFLGHWRTFDIHFYDRDRTQFMIGRHPFRWFFQQLQVYDSTGNFLGTVRRHFAIFTKRFGVYDSNGRSIMQVASPFWRIWTFSFIGRGGERARILKKWSGIGSEIFTDRDNFLVEYRDATLSSEERALVMAAAIYVDLMYFERHGKN